MKRKFLFIFFVGIFLALTSSNVIAIDKRSVLDFQGYCAEKHALYPYCSGIVEGLFYILEVNSRSDAKIQICFPKGGVQLGEGVNAFVEWAKANPHHAEKPGVWGIATALLSEWPCTE